jgi:hypothetical protein
VSSTGIAGHTTYQVAINFGADVQDVCALPRPTFLRQQLVSCAAHTRELIESVNACIDAIYGEEGVPLSIPPAYQVATPFGTNIGPPNPAFFAVMADCEFDSFITLGMDGPAAQSGALSAVGVDFDAWDETTGLRTTDGAVFFMDPDHGATSEPVTIAQLTVRTGTTFTGTFSAQGRSVGGVEDWVENAMSFSSANVGQAVSAGGTKALIGH